MTKKKIFITGGAGFIGTSLIKNLIDSGYKINCLDLQKPKHPISKNLKFFKGSINDKKLVKKANAKLGERVTMPKLSDIALLLKEKNIAYKLWDFADGVYDLELKDYPITMKNSSPYYSRNTSYYAKKLVEIINK